MTIASELTLLSNTKAAIKTAIEAKGVTVGTVPFSQYPTKIGEISGGGGGFDIPDSWSQEWYEEVLAYAESQAWTPPADWLTLPTVVATDQVMHALVMVTNSETNWVDVSATGAFTVDWGDGTVENFASGAVATHNYVWSSISSSTVTSEGYRQVIFTVTPQAGQTLTLLKLGNAITGLTDYPTKIVDVVFAMNNAGDFQRTGTFNRNIELKRFRWKGTNSRTNFSSYFVDMYNLESIELDTSGATLMNSMFSGCRSLKTIPVLDTSAVTNIGTMFSGCTSLITIPELDFSAANSGDLSNLFATCSNLITTPALTFNGNATTTTSMFSGCSNLLYIGPLTWNASVANRTLANSSMFNGCTNLQKTPVMTNSFSGGYISFTNSTSVYANCRNLREISMIFSGVTNFGNTPVTGCVELRKLSIELRTGPYTISSWSLGSLLINLETLTLTYPDGANITFTPSGVANNDLQNLRNFEISCNIGTSSFNFPGKRSLSRLILNNCVASVTINDCALGPQALVDLFTSLGTATAKTINITGNWGASLLTSEQRAIATGKGFTITG